MPVISTPCRRAGSDGIGQAKLMTKARISETIKKRWMRTRAWASRRDFLDRRDVSSRIQNRLYARAIATAGRMKSAEIVMSNAWSLAHHFYGVNIK